MGTWKCYQYLIWVEYIQHLNFVAEGIEYKIGYSIFTAKQFN